MEVINQQNLFGDLIRSWRKKRNLSQLTLANAMDSTSRHISFVETGRSKPTQSMIMRLAEAMDIPYRERNILFRAAGFSEQYQDRDFHHPDLSMMHRAIELILNNHHPFPGFVLDRYWNLLNYNCAGESMLTIMLGHPPEKEKTNLVMALFTSKSMRENVENWQELAKHMIQRIKRESFDDEESSALLHKIQQTVVLPEEYWEIDLEQSLQPLFAMTVNLPDAGKMTFLSTVTTFGTPVDVMAQEIRIELVFPADPETEAKMLAKAES